MTSKTTAAVSALDAATAAFTTLQEQYRTAQEEALTAQEYADSLPGRLAAGDESVSTEDLIQAAPAAAIAQAKAQALAHQLTAAREAVMQAQTDELASQLRTGAPFLQWGSIDAELEAIAAQLTGPLDALTERIEAHNLALSALTSVAHRNVGETYTVSDGQELKVTRQGIELDGKWWQELSAENLAELVGQKARQAQLREQALKHTPSSELVRDLTEHELLQRDAERWAQHQREQGAQ